MGEWVLHAYQEQKELGRFASRQRMEQFAEDQLQRHELGLDLQSWRDWDLIQRGKQQPTVFGIVPEQQRQGISYELLDAWDLPAPDRGSLMDELTRAETQVLSWLQAHRHEIVAAERRWDVDRRAIAGAIAWEALQNCSPGIFQTLGLGRSAGPGKVHYSTERTWGEGDPVSRQIETAGYLPSLTMAARRERLGTIEGAIDYIGAIMAAQADIAAASRHRFSMRRRPDILTFAYNGHDLRTWKAHLEVRPLGEPFRPGERMASWVTDHIRYIEAGVGKPDTGF